MNTNNGWVTISEVTDGLLLLIEDTNWEPSGFSGNSKIRLIEVKAMLINAKSKLMQVAIDEGYLDE
ncbi:MAG: hypothetical protein DRO67_00600 [Candidatus Asgardarchaeum californiense]|nr:MAG: hypothetical protein DRO67_00600 [Candidatus Asgardarchaeum californiense]